MLKKILNGFHAFKAAIMDETERVSKVRQRQKRENRTGGEKEGKETRPALLGINRQFIESIRFAVVQSRSFSQEWHTLE